MGKTGHLPQCLKKIFSAPSVTHPAAVCGWRWHLGVVGLLAVVAALLYYPSLHAPWYMDDVTAIAENQDIRDLGGSLGKIFRTRGLALFSFALNYHFGGTDPFGYHLVNLGLHLGCGLLVYLLLRRVVHESVLLPVLGALIFIAHPLQTQAVTYVVQRMAVLAALFFLLSLWLFVRARERLTAGVPFAASGHLRYYLGALLAGLCAIFTKENTAVLPVVLYLYVTFFLPPAGDRRRLLLSLLPFAAGPLALASVRLFVPLAAGESLTTITGTTRLVDAQYLTPLHYLVTEFSVLWVYIRMLFLPYGQALEHGYPVAASLLDPLHLVAGAGLVLLGALAVRLRRRQPLISAGIAWFFLTLAVESSVIPLDPLFEHRLYLPMFGFVLVLLGLLRLLPGRRAGIAVLAAMVLVCLPLTWQRNRLWADPVTFYRDNLAKVHNSERVLNDLAARYLDAGRYTDAEPLLLQALELNPEFIDIYTNLVVVYTEQGRLPEAFALARKGLAKELRSEQLLTALGILYYKSSDLDHALQTLDQALEINPDYALALSNRAAFLAQSGRIAEAEAAFRKALALNAVDVVLRNDLALALKMQGKTGEAEVELRRIVEIDPDNRDALFRLGLLAIDRGDPAQATALAKRLQRSDPPRARELEQRLREGR
jgi:protein O-mannosyl-transferase